MNKKSQGPLTAASKKNDHRKLKGSQSLILCYNCGKEEHIHFNCSHSSKNNTHQIQVIKMPNINLTLKHSKNLKGSQQSEALKSHHSNHKE